MKHMVKALTKNKKWIKGYLVDVTTPTGNYKGVLDSFDISNPSSNVPVEIIEDSVCKCSGKKDARGNILFENDALKDYLSGETYIIVLDEGNFLLSDKHGFFKFFWDGADYILEDNSATKIKESA